MKKIIIIIILIAMIITGFYLYTKNKTVVNTDGTTTNTGVSFRDFFPFSKPTTNTNSDSPIIPVPDYNIPADTNNELPKLKKIFSEPVAGISLITKDEPIVIEVDQITPSVPPTPTPKITTPPKPLTQKVEYLRLVEKQNGHISEIELKDYKVSKITNTTIPKVYEAYFGLNGNNIILRYLNENNKTIRTYLAKLIPNDSTNDTVALYKLEGSFLPDDISTISISPSTNKLFYLFPFNTGMVGNILDLTNNKKIQNLDTPFHNWLSSFVGEDNIVLTTKASAVATSYSYLIDKLGNWNKILGNIYGMTTNISGDGKNLAFSSYTNSGLILSLLNTKTNMTMRAPANTLSEKCTWSADNINLYCAIPDSIPEGDYPDSWYQGLVSFSDTMWKINQDGNGTSLTQLPNIDAINILVNKDQNKLFFINNKDKSVWELDI